MKIKFTRMVSMWIALASLFFTHWVYAENQMTLTEVQGQSYATYPLTLGRAFVQGEVMNFPQAVLNGQPLATQASVKNRWPDGSVQFAVLSFLVPSLGANQAKNITFTDQTGANDQGYLSPQSLAAFPGLNAKVILRYQGQSREVSLRDMLQAGVIEYWHKGPIATQFILADHSYDRRFDVGFDQYRNVRVIFHGLIYPSLNKIFIRVVLENTNTEILQNVNYDLEIQTGEPLQTVYTKSAVTQYYASRITKTFWVGGEPGKVNLDPNIAYLAQTKLLPNYDATLQVNSSVVNTWYQNFRNKPTDINDLGFFIDAWNATGGRSDIGLFPTWDVLWLYTGRWEMEEIAQTHANLAGRWTNNFREGSLGRRYDRAQLVNALGLPLSTEARPTVWLAPGNGHINRERGQAYYTNEQDKLTIVGDIDEGNCRQDSAHMPTMFVVPYLLKGDPFYLEGLQFWSSWVSFYPPPESRGLSGRGGAIKGEWRAFGQGGKIRAYGYMLSPDASPQKNYFKQLIEDFIAAEEGTRDLVGSAYQQNPLFDWGRTIRRSELLGTYGLGPLHFWDLGGRDSGNVFNTVIKGTDSNWMLSLIILHQGILKDFGFHVDPLLRWTGEFLTGFMENPAHQCYVAAYTTPIERGIYLNNNLVGNGLFTSYDEIVSSYLMSQSQMCDYFLSKVEDPSYGYGYLLQAASTYLRHLPRGQELYDFFSPFREGTARSVELPNNPKWGILPRDMGSQQGTPPFISSLSPNGFRFDQAQTIRIVGERFESNFVAIEIDGHLYTPQDLHARFVNAQALEFQYAARSLQAGEYGIRVQAANGRWSNLIFLNLLGDTVNPPTLTALSPSAIDNRQTQVVDVSGQNLNLPGLTVKINGQTFSNQFYQIQSATLISLTFAQGFAPGTYRIQVATAQNQWSNELTLQVNETSGSGPGGASGGGNGGGTQNGGSNTLTKTNLSTSNNSEAGDIAGFGCQAAKSSADGGGLLMMVLLSLWMLKEKNRNCIPKGA